MSRSRRPRKLGAIPEPRSATMGSQRTFPATASNGREMDFRTRSAKERAAHYQQEAEKFRRMAAAEPVEHIREQLIRVAEQYQRLADTLNNRPWLTTS